MTLSYADIASTVAIGLSLLALYQVGSHRTRDMSVQARKDKVRILTGLAGAEERITDADQQWKAVLAARGMFQSGAMVQKQQAAEELRTRAKQLFKEAEGLKVPTVPFISSFLIDQCATRVGTCLLKWELLSADIDALAAGAKENRALLNRK